MADETLFELTALTTAAVGDLFEVVDISDTTFGANGTNKKITLANFKTSLSFTASDISLGNVNNTSDANKPVSTATQAALDLKANLASPTFTGTPAGPTASAATNTTQLATTAFVRGEIAALVASSPSALDTLNELAAALNNDASFAATMTTALGLKAPLISPSFTTPALGTVASGNIAACTGYLASATGVTDSAGIFTGTTVETVLLELAKVPVKITSGNYTIGTTDSRELYGGVIYVTGAATITIPAVAAGASFTVVTIGAVAVSVDPNALDLIYLDGTALSDGDKITNLSAAGDVAVFTYYDATGWSASTNGWTDGN